MAKNKALQALAEHPLTAKFVKSLQHSDLPTGWQENPEIVDMAARAYSEAGTDSPFFKAYENALGKTENMYHGTSAAFDTFSPHKMGETGTAYGRGYYLTPSKDYAMGYGDNIMDLYVATENSFSPTSKKLTPKKIKDLSLDIAKKEMAISPDEIEHIGDTNILSSFGDVRYEGLKSVLDEISNALKYDENVVDQINGLMAVSGNYTTVADAVRDVLGKTGIKTTDPNIFVAMQPNIIKSKQNRGTFDPSDPNILRSIAPYAAGAGLAGGLLSSPENVWASYNEPPRDAIEESWNPVEALAGGLGGGVVSAFAGVPIDLAATIGMDKLGGLLSAPGGNATDYGNIRSWR